MGDIMVAVSCLPVHTQLDRLGQELCACAELSDHASCVQNGARPFCQPIKHGLGHVERSTLCLIQFLARKEFHPPILASRLSNESELAVVWCLRDINYYLIPKVGDSIEHDPNKISVTSGNDSSSQC